MADAGAPDGKLVHAVSRAEARMETTDLDDSKPVTPAGLPETLYNPFEREVSRLEHDSARERELDISYPPKPSSVVGREGEAGVEHAIHPPDRGKAAYMFLLSAFTLDVMVWGWGFAWGTFQSHYHSHPPFNAYPTSSIAAVGTVSLTLTYSTIFFATVAWRRYPESIKISMWVALFVCVASLIGSSWATTIGQLIALQGVTFGIGCGVLYTPMLLWCSEWFVERRGLACGIVFSGSGFGGAVFPVLIEFCLSKLGFRWTLRIWAIAYGLVAGLSLVFVKPRIPTPVYRHKRDRPSLLPAGLEIWRSRLFWAFCLSCTLQGLAYFPVSIYLPTWVENFATPAKASAVLAVHNVAITFSQIAFGWATDRTAYYWPLIWSGIAGALCSFVIWAFAVQLATAFVFAIVFGFCFGGTASVWIRASFDVSEQPIHAGIAFGAFNVAKGISAVASSFISSAMYNQSKADNKQLYGSFGFLGMQLYVGIACLVFSAGSVLVALLSKRQKTA